MDVVESVKKLTERIVGLLATGDYIAVEGMTSGRVNHAQLKEAVDDFGQTLIPLPRDAVDNLDILEIPGGDYSIVCDLWTKERGASDLTLEMRISFRDGKETIVIDGVHVL